MKNAACKLLIDSHNIILSKKRNLRTHFLRPLLQPIGMLLPRFASFDEHFANVANIAFVPVHPLVQTLRTISVGKKGTILIDAKITQGARSTKPLPSTLRSNQTKRNTK